MQQQRPVAFAKLVVLLRVFVVILVVFLLLHRYLYSYRHVAVVVTAF